MSNEKKYRHGQFVWRELMSTDVARSQRFYGELFGWTTQTVPMPQGDYIMFVAGERPVGGLWDATQLGPGVPAHWLGYVSVADVDAAAASAKARGSRILAQEDIPGVGRFATFLDPQGAVVSAFKAVDGDGEGPGPGNPPGPGQFCWEELHATDPGAAGAFYTQVFPWTVAPFGDGKSPIQLFLSPSAAAASFQPAHGGAPAHWLSYVVVPTLAAAREKVTQLGGQVLVEHVAVPGVGHIAVARDDVGAFIGLFER